MIRVIDHRLLCICICSCWTSSPWKASSLPSNRCSDVTQLHSSPVLALVIYISAYKNLKILLTRENVPYLITYYIAVASQRSQWSVLSVQSIFGGVDRRHIRVSDSQVCGVCNVTIPVNIRFRSYLMCAERQLSRLQPSCSSSTFHNQHMHRVLSGTAPLRGLSAITHQIVQLVQVMLSARASRPPGTSRGERGLHPHTLAYGRGRAPLGGRSRGGREGMLRGLTHGSGALAVTATREVLHATYQVQRVHNALVNALLGSYHNLVSKITVAYCLVQAGFRSCFCLGSLSLCLYLFEFFYLSCWSVLLPLCDDSQSYATKHLVVVGRGVAGNSCWADFTEHSEDIRY